MDVAYSDSIGLSSIPPTAADATALSNGSVPMLPGDTLDSIIVHARSGPTNDVSSCDPSIEVYACNSKPTTVAEARAGTCLLVSTVLISAPYEFLNDAAQSVAWMFDAALPVSFSPAVYQRYIAVVMTASSNGSLTATLSAKIFRAPRK